MKKLILCSILGLVLALMMAPAVTYAQDMCVSSIDITITEPKYNAVNDYSFTINSQGVTKATNGAWYNSSECRWMTSGEKFEDGKIYKFMAYIDVQSGYSWPDNLNSVSVTINGVRVTLEGVSGQNYKCASATFDCTATTINAVYLSGVTEPVNGETMSTHYGNNSLCYDVGEAEWYDCSTGKKMQAGDKFVGGRDYKFTAYVKPYTYCVWGDNAGAQVNHKLAVLTPYDGDTRAVSITFTCEAPQVKTITITGITEPVHGQDKSTECKYDTSEGYKVYSIGWINESDGGWMQDGEKFVGGKTYKCCVYMELQSGYSWSTSGGITATINDNTAKLLDVAGEGNKKCASFEYTCEAPQVKTITITGITEPVHGQEKSTECKYDTSEGYKVYSIGWFNESDGDWMQDGEKFVGGKTYKCCVYMELQSSYSWSTSGGITATINDNTAKLLDVAGEGNKKCASFEYTCEAPQVKNITITGITEPVHGQDKSTECKYDTSEGYRVYSIGWINESDGGWMQDGEKFVGGKTYKCCVYMELQSGYSWSTSGGITATINDNTAKLLDVAGEGNKKCVSFEYTCSKATVKTVNITGMKAPVAGGKVSDYCKLAVTDSNCIIVSCSWFRAKDNSAMGANEAFEAGQEYYIGVFVEAVNGYVINSDTKISFSGSDASVNYGLTKIESGKLDVYTSGWKLVGKHTVTFNMNGHGIAPASQTVDSGNKAKMPGGIPTTEGYTFIGWYADAEGTVEFDFNTAITKDTVIYAKWIKNSNNYSVTFNMNGHGTKVEAQTVKEGEKAVKPADPAATGYTFKGWFADTALKTEFDFNTAINANTTIYAKWEENAAEQPGGDTTEPGGDVTWTSDENSHWHAATCGDTEDVIDKAAHTWDAGKVTKEATVDSTGVMTYTCSVCKAVKTVEIPKLTPTVAPTPAPEPVIVITPQETQESQGTSETQGAAESQGTTDSQGTSETQGTAESADTPDAEDGKTSETEKDEEDGRTSENEEGEKTATVETVKSDLAEVFTENKVAVTEQEIESAVPATKKDSAYYDESGKKITNSFIRTSNNKYRYVGTTGKSVKKAVVATVDTATGEMKMYYAGKNGVIVKNKVVTLPDGGKIFASKDGSLATKQVVTSGKHQYYADENGKLLTNQIIKMEDGTRYYANKYGRIRKNALFTAPDGDKRYATADGTLAKSCWVTVGKKMYWCNKIGRITKSKPVEGN